MEESINHLFWDGMGFYCADDSGAAYVKVEHGGVWYSDPSDAVGSIGGYVLVIDMVLVRMPDMYPDDATLMLYDDEL